MSCHAPGGPTECVLPVSTVPLTCGCPILNGSLLAQADLTPAEAAALWSTVKSEAGSLGAEIVSPAVNFCGGDCNQEVGHRIHRECVLSSSDHAPRTRCIVACFWWL